MSSRPQRRTLLWLFTGALAIFVVGISFVVATAALQTRAERPELREVSAHTPPDGAPTVGQSAPSVRLELDVAVAQLVLLPTESGTPFRAESSFDPSAYELELESPSAGNDGPHRLVFRPRGSEAWALFRAKVSGQFPVGRVFVPSDVSLELTGELRGGLAAIELGGTAIRAIDLRVDGGAVTVSLTKPTIQPLDRFELRVAKGSLEVTGLGNGSPRTSTIEQRLGVLDLDLRGQWQGTSLVQLEFGTVGGTLWIPSDVRVEGLGRSDMARAPAVHSELGTAPALVVLEAEPLPRSLVLIE